MDGGTKRPLPSSWQLEDSNEAQDGRPAKRQETAQPAREPPRVVNGSSNIIFPRAGEHMFSEAEVRNKSPEELVGLILDLQALHRREVSNLAVQCATFKRQLDSLKQTMASYVSSQNTALQQVAKHINQADLLPPPTAPPVDSLIGQRPTSLLVSSGNSLNPITALPQSSPYRSLPSRPPANHYPTPGVPVYTSSAPLPRRISSPSLAQQSSSSRPGTPAPSISTPTPTLGDPSPQQPSSQQPRPAGNPPQVQCSNLNTVTEIWREYRHGIDGSPAIESLDAQWGSRWRPEPKIRTWYSRRKLIYDKIKELMADGLDEATAVREVEAMRRSRSMNWLMKLLQDDRRETKANWKKAAAAAMEAKKAQSVVPASATAPPGPENTGALTGNATLPS